LPPQWATTKAAKREGQRAKLRTTLAKIYKKNTELKAALTGSTVGQKAARQGNHDQKRKTLTLCSNLEVAEGDGVGVDEVGDE
jgi:hypothetical protein